jgi:hypothetical protein
MVWSQPRQIFWETLSQRKPITKKAWWSGSRCWTWVQTPVPHTQKNLSWVVHTYNLSTWVADIFRARLDYIVGKPCLK